LTGLKPEAKGAAVLAKRCGGIAKETHEHVIRLCRRW
jgi:hypothetical protein